MRKLSVRERVLLVCLAVLAVVSGYVLLFYTPLSQRTAALEEQLTQSEELSAQLEGRLEEQRQMERELELLAAQEDAPIPMPESDNLQAVLVELNDILSDCQEYSLSFQGEQSEDYIFRRQVSIPFTCGSYQSAREILQRLHDSSLRCLLEDVHLTQQEDGTVHTTVSMTFFSYDETAKPTE